MSSYTNARAENEQLRSKQAEKICQQVPKGDKWDAMLLGMDMNDHPFLKVHNVFTGCGFVDSIKAGTK